MLFFATLRKLGLSRRDGVLATIAFVPVIYINSTVSLDYVWALGFLIGSLYTVVLGRPALAGIALGAAIGCRLTSGAMIVPLCLLLVETAPKGIRIPRAAVFAFSAILVGAVSYLPVLLSYGPEFLRFGDELISASLRTRLVLYGMTVGVWGGAGTAALMVLFVVFLILSLLRLPAGLSARIFVVSCIIAIVLYVL